jgi:HD-like signal output (HDOD) protein
MPVAVVISRERILQAARSLPAAPQAMAGLCELLQDPNADLGKIADQISVDAALAARVVRISNSVAFGGGGAVGSVDEAVGRVGFGEILRLVGAATVANLVDRHLPGYDIPASRLRESLFLHAIASETLARFSSVDPRTAYTAGLLRAIGMMVVAQVACSEMRPEDGYTAWRHPTYHDWEGEHFGLANPEVAAMVLTEWRFPLPVVSAIREHWLMRERGLDNPFACVLNLAGAIVVEGGLALAGEEACWVRSPQKLAALGLDEEQWQRAKTESLAQFNRLLVALN